MGYDFTRFSPQSFEAFAQSLATSVIGPGVQVYGAGPDGARDASYNGPMPLSTNAHQWSGYLVAQAKYKANTNTDDSFEWIKAQIEAELSKFIDKKRALPKPEYYLLITNAPLTPNAANSTGKGAGGIDKIDNLFKSWADRVPLKGWQVWHSDKLAALIDNEEGIRHRYSAWVTEGDVFSKLLEMLGNEVGHNTLTRAIVRDLSKDRDMKRKDSGATPKKLYLDDLFVDLPLSSQHANLTYWRQLSPDDRLEFSDSRPPVYMELHDPSEHRLNALAQLLERSFDKFDHSTLHDGSPTKSTPHRNRVVLLGGPGQGKSTVAQFLAQVCRARIATQSPHRLSAEALENASAVLHRAAAEGLPLSGPCRYPVHVDLPRFADKLSSRDKAQEPLSVLSYVAGLLSAGSDDAISRGQLRKWLASYPWLLILDGLDEVPPSSNRSEVISAINDFWDEVAEADADVLAVVTTRPQGYGDDFPRRRWDHWALENLDAASALHFARRLADTSLSDISRKDEILAELERAATDTSTAPLMVSPLQVSILFTLVETKGSVPSDRWTLFQRHYELLRDREAAKGGEYSSILRQYRSQIDQLHFDAGFLLHVRAELAGSANAFMTEVEFLALVSKQLTSEGHDSETVEKVAGTLAIIATDRLVMLGCKTSGQIAFDVRSLQEFMAAARIMSSPEFQIDARLREIAARTHWRHVMRIACSKVFAQPELQHLRTNVIHICDALDSGDVSRPDELVKSGARLAIDLLEDGIALKLPQLRRSLVKRAFSIIPLGLANADKLYLFYDSMTSVVFREELEARLAGKYSAANRTYFRLLFFLVSRDEKIPWAEILLEKFWAQNASRTLSEYRLCGYPPLSRYTKERLTNAQRGAGYVDNRVLLRLAPDHEEGFDISTLDSDISTVTSAIDLNKDPLRITFRLSQNRHSALYILARRVDSDFGVDVERIVTKSGWESAKVVVSFVREPSRKTLAEAVRALEHVKSLNLPGTTTLPWPIVLGLAELEVASVDEVCARILRGDLGSVDDWRKAELRWGESGISVQDIRAWRSGSFLNPDIANVGMPPLISRVLFLERDDEELGRVAFAEYLGAVASLPSGSVFARRANELIRPVFRYASRAHQDEFLRQNLEAEGCVRADLSQGTIDAFVRCAPETTEEDWWRVAADDIGRNHTVHQYYAAELLPELVAAAVARPDLRGLLALVAAGLGDRANLDLSNFSDLDLTEKPNDGSIILSSVAAIRLSTGRWKSQDHEHLAALLVTNDGRSPPWVNRLPVSPGIDDTSPIFAMGTIFEKISTAKPEIIPSVSDRFSSILARRPSAYADQAKCEELHLPVL